VSAIGGDVSRGRLGSTAFGAVVTVVVGGVIAGGTSTLSPVLRRSVHPPTSIRVASAVAAATNNG
jgi:hypothetical protein